MLKKIKNLVNAIMMVVTFIMIIYFIVNKMPSRLLSCFCLYPLILLPFIVNKIGYKINNNLTFIYTIYLFFAQFLGSIINLYKMIWFYDLIIHFISGFLLIMFLVSISNLSRETHPFIYSIGFVSFISLLWEIFEFVTDLLLKTNMQHLETGTRDTMEDIIISLIGGMVGYLLLAKDKKNYE